MENIEIRRALDENKIKHWELAYKMGISEFTFSRWLRKEISEEKKIVIMQSIKIIAADRPIPK